MIIHGIVPSMFGLGITMLLLKGHNLTVVCRIIIGVSPVVGIYQKFLRCIFWTFTVIILQLLTYSMALRNVLVAVTLCIL